jgi:hypothetical protein
VLIGSSRGAGARRGELANLKASYVDLEARVLTIPTRSRRAASALSP